MCESLVVSSFGVATETSPITMLSITLYKFVVRSVLRTIMEPLMTFRVPCIPMKLYLWAFKAPNERRIFLRSGTCLTFLSIHTRPLNIFMQMLLFHLFYLQHHYPLGLCFLQRLICVEPLLFGHMWYVHPDSSNQAFENLLLSLLGFIDRTSHDFSTASSAMPAWFIYFLLVLAPLAPGPPLFFSISLTWSNSSSCVLTVCNNINQYFH